jgi:uncharacterized membrane protein YsdA (DUF1294 family)
MPENILTYIAVYLAVVSIWAVGLTVFDKQVAKHGLRRVKERTLLLVSAFGGSLAMFVTMHLIRDKTKHAKFMVGIPAIIILQVAVVLFAVWRLKGGAI